MTKTLIRVGHSAYTGANSYRLCFSKAQAVRVLCNRGVKRDEARKTVSKAITELGATVYGEHHEIIEVVNQDWQLCHGHYMHSYETLRRRWAKASEL